MVDTAAATAAGTAALAEVAEVAAAAEVVVEDLVGVVVVVRPVELSHSPPLRTRLCRVSAALCRTTCRRAGRPGRHRLLPTLSLAVVLEVLLAVLVVVVVVVVGMLEPRPAA